MAEQAVTAEPRRSPKIHPSRFKLAEHVVNTYCITVEPGTPVDALQDPAFWSHVSKMLRPGDEIKVRTDDGAYAALLFVKDVAHQSALVVPLWHIDLSKVEELQAADEYEVEWAGPHHKFRVIRKSDRTVIQAGFDNKQAAIAHMAGHIRSMAA